MAQNAGARDQDLSLKAERRRHQNKELGLMSLLIGIGQIVAGVTSVVKLAKLLSRTGSPNPDFFYNLQNHWLGLLTLCVMGAALQGRMRKMSAMGLANAILLFVGIFLHRYLEAGGLRSAILGLLILGELVVIGMIIAITFRKETHPPSFQ